MEPVLLTAFFVFVTAAAAVGLAARAWEAARRRRRWRRATRRVQQLGGGAGDTGGAAGATLLRGVEDEPAGWAAWLLRAVPPLRGIEPLLDQAAATWGVEGFLRRALLFGIVLAVVLLLLAGSPAALPVGLLLGPAVPYLQLRRARARRLARFEEQLPTAVDLLMRAIRAGHPFAAGLKVVAEESPEPLASEFRRVFEEQKFGLSLQESLQGLAARVDLPDVRIFVTAVSIQREVGGNLAEILEGISETIRERFTIQRQVRVYTAQGRLTGVMLALLPIGLGLLLGLINPEYMRGMITTGAGQAMLAAAGFLQLVGYMIIRRITTIEV